jgi:hypothetical protein
MKKSLIALALMSAMACKTTEASSTSSSASPALAATADKAQVSPAAKGAKTVEYGSKSSGKITDEQVSADESLMKWRVGRWSIVASNGDTNEKMDKAGTIACDVTAEAVKKLLGAEKLLAVKAAIAELYKVKDQRQSSPIFRGLQNSRELVASFKGEEFLIEKMYQSRDIIVAETPESVGRELPKASAVQAALETLMEVAINPKICPTIPN